MRKALDVFLYKGDYFYLMRKDQRCQVHRI